MTNEEKELLEKLGEVMVDFNKLSIMHPFDAQEFIFHVHAMQNIILARVALRQRAGIV